MKKRGLAALFTLDVAFLLAMGMIGVGFIYDSRRINPTAAALPRYTSIVMIVLILFVLYGKVRDAYRPSGSVEPVAPSNEPTCEVVPGAAAPVTGRQLPWYVTWLLIASYPFLVLGVGFSIATFVFLAGMSLIMGTKLHVAIIYGAVGAAAMILLFIIVLKVPMPDSALSDLIPALAGY